MLYKRPAFTDVDAIGKLNAALAGDTVAAITVCIEVDSSVCSPSRAEPRRVLPCLLSCMGGFWNPSTCSWQGVSPPLLHVTDLI